MGKPSTVQITLRIPREWIAEAEEIARIADDEQPFGPHTQTDIFRAAILRGLKELRKDLK